MAAIHPNRGKAPGQALLYRERERPNGNGASRGLHSLRVLRSWVVTGASVNEKMPALFVVRFPDVVYKEPNRLVVAVSVHSVEYLVSAGRKHMFPVVVLPLFAVTVDA